MTGRELEIQRQEYFDKGGYGDNEKLASGGYGRLLLTDITLSSLPPIYQSWMWLTRAVVVNNSLTITDLGCGNGRLSVPIIRYFADQGIKVHANLVDLSLQSLSEVSTTTSHTNLESRCMQADIRSLPLVSNSSDSILSTMVLHWLNDTDQRRAIREFRRVLKPGGMLLIDVASIFNAMCIGKADDTRLREMLRRSSHARSKETFPILHPGFQRYVYPFTEARITTLLQQAGFEVEVLEWYKNDYPNLQPNYREGIRVLAHST